MREVEQDSILGIEEDINSWQQEVILLVKDVICSSEFELDFGLLEVVKMWTFEKVNQLKEHIRGRMKLEMPKGRLQELMFEFRKAWEGVWLGYLEDQRNARGGFFQTANFGVECSTGLGH